jgi:hypothetical protein
MPSTTVSPSNSPFLPEEPATDEEMRAYLRQVALQYAHRELENVYAADEGPEAGEPSITPAYVLITLALRALTLLLYALPLWVGLVGVGVKVSFLTLYCLTWGAFGLLARIHRLLSTRR